MPRKNLRLKSLNLKTIIKSDSDEEELELAFATVGIFRYWRSEIKPALCVIGGGICKLGVLESEYNRYNFEELSISDVVDRVLDARIKDDKDGGVVA